MKNLNYSNQTQCNLKQFKTISCCESAWWMFHSIIQLWFHLHPSSAFVSSLQANSQWKFSSGSGSFSPVTWASTPASTMWPLWHSLHAMAQGGRLGARGALWSIATVGTRALWEQLFLGLSVGSTARITHWPVTSCTSEDVWEAAKAQLLHF